MEHGLEARRHVPSARFESFPGAGHFPYRDDPRRFVATLSDFMETTQPADLSEEKVRELLRRGG